jgi:hypothetical protein
VAKTNPVRSWQRFIAEVLFWQVGLAEDRMGMPLDVSTTSASGFQMKATWF